MAARSEAMLMNPADIKNVLGWFLRHTAADASLPTRLARLVTFFTEARPAMKEIMGSHCEVAEMMARRLGFPENVQQTVRYTWEQWNGRGMVYGLKGPQTPAPARILHLAQVLQVAHSFGGTSSAVAIARERRGADFDPDLVGAFLELSERAGFWQVLEQEAVQSTVLAMKPPAPFDEVSDSQMDTVCEVMADFTDIAAQHTWNHSRTVADIASSMGRHVGLPKGEVIRLRRAALVHDLGKVAVPGAVLQKQEDLSESEWEAFRLHPYYTERVLSRVDKLNSLAPVAGSHHEWVNGQGYHRQLTREQIPLGGRILAAADVYALFAKRRPDPGDPKEVLEDMRPLVGTQVDPICFEALSASLDGAAPPGRSRRRGQNPGGLTDREIEVLRQLSNGLSNREISKELVI